MPTVGWILETAEDRYWEGPPDPPPSPPKVRCPCCDGEFSSSGELQKHLGIAHPLGIPMLLFLGTPAPSDLIVRQLPKAGDFVLHNCTQCRVVRPSFESHLDPDELPEWLIDNPTGHVLVELENNRALDEDRASAKKSYRIEFRLTSDDVLNECDRLFIERLVVRQPTMAEVDAYRRSVPTDGAAREYAGALADYVVGLLLKEQARDRGVQGGFETYEAKFLGVLDTLGAFPRRLAKVVATTIEFNLNAWDSIDPPSQLRDLSRAVTFFRSLCDTPREAKAPTAAVTSERPICPLDVVTDRILHTVALLLQRPDDCGDTPVRTLQGLESRVPVGEFDLVKINVIGAVSGIWNQDARLAKESLRRLRFDDRFGEWASATLTELASSG